MNDFSDLRAYDLCYLGTPYSKFTLGVNVAFIEAAELTARLVRSGVNAYSPIAHTHPIAVFGDIDPLDHLIWLPFDIAMMNKSDAMIVAKMAGWEQSHGIAEEMKIFKSDGKPIYFLDPKTFHTEIDE